MSQGPIIMEASPGEHVGDFAERMIAKALEVNGEVWGQFNQYTLDCQPGMTRKQVMQSWDTAQRVSYFGDAP